MRHIVNTPHSNNMLSYFLYSSHLFDIITSGNLSPNWFECKQLKINKNSSNIEALRTKMEYNEKKLVQKKETNHFETVEKFQYNFSSQNCHKLSRCIFFAHLHIDSFIFILLASPFFQLIRIRQFFFGFKMINISKLLRNNKSNDLFIFSKKKKK